MRDVGRLAVGVIALAGAATVLQVLRLLSCFSALDDLQRANAAGTTLSPLTTGYGQAGLALVLVLVVAWAVTCRWLVAARAPAWVWLGWWVPVVSLWYPRRVLVDLMATHGVAVRRRHPDDLGRWWAGWVAWALATTGAAVVARVAESPGTLVAVPVLEGVAVWGLVAAAVPWCRLVHDLAEAQRPQPERVEV